MRSPHNRGMNELEQPRWGKSVVRLLAAALAGAIGAFGMPVAAAHRAEQAPSATAATTAAVAPDVQVVD
jgi:hypothetical protein